MSAAYIALARQYQTMTNKKSSSILGARCQRLRAKYE